MDFSPLLQQWFSGNWVLSRWIIPPVLGSFGSLCYFPLIRIKQYYFADYVGTWRIIPVSKWLVAPVYKKFRQFGRGFLEHGYLPLTNPGMVLQVGLTPRETNIAMENGPFEDVFPIQNGDIPLLLLMEEILHRLIGSLSHYLQFFLHPRLHCHLTG